MWEPLTPTSEPVRGLTGAQNVERERASAWGYYVNGGGGVIAYFDGYAWDKMVCRRLEDDREQMRERSR
jgi:hypothetical protein